MTILLLGGSGQLGQELSKRAFNEGLDLISPVSKDLDISNEIQINRLVQNVKPSCIINAAAYTAVDQAEKEVERAYAVNAYAPGYLASAARSVNARLIHISTDYVFSGDVEKDLGLVRPYCENDPKGPLSVYGESKLAGEEACLEKWSDNTIILRTSSLFGGKGPNFVLTMLRLFGNNRQLQVVSDQFMSPTWAGWLAEVVLQVVDSPATGVYHASCSGSVSWYRFATAIYDEALKRPANERAADIFAEILPIEAANYSRPAKRPSYSVMDSNRLLELGISLMSWESGLTNYLNEFKVLPIGD